MAQHKTIDRRKAATDTQSVAQRLAAQNAGQQTRPSAASGNAGAQKQNTQTYYSPREYGSQSQALGTRVTAAQTAMQERSAALEKSRRAMEQLYAQAGEKRQRYYDLTGSFVGDSAAEYEQRILDDWTEAMALYEQGRSEYQKAYDAYKPYEDAYNAALTAYNEYQTQEQAAYDQWRASVRSADEIRQDRQEIRGKRAELERLMKENNRLANPVGANSGAEIVGRDATIAGNEARIRELQEYLGGIGEREKLLDEELGWSERLRWEELRQNEDFARESQYDVTVKDEDYHWINDTDMTSLRNAMRSEQDPFAVKQHMTADEIAMYNYLYSSQGEKTAKEYLKYLEPELNRRNAQQSDERMQELGKNHPVLSSALSVALSPVSGVTSAAGIIAEKITGQEIDPNSPWFNVSNQKNAIREAVAGQIEESLGETWGPVGSVGYNIGMSMLDMLADKWSGIGLAGGGKGSGLAIKGLMGSRAVAETVIDGKNRGLSDEQAIKLGLVSGAAELITEGIGLDEMLKLPEGMKDAGFWRGALKGAVGEAGEEGLTNLANLVADISIAGDKSEFMQNTKRYKAQGKDPVTASVLALKEAGISLGLDMLGGAISGGVFGGVDAARGKRGAGTKRSKAAADRLADSLRAGIADPVEDDMDTQPVVGAHTGSGEGTTDRGKKPVSDGVNENAPVAGGVPARTVGGVPMDDAGDADGMTLEEVRAAAINRRNPLVSKVLPTAQVEEEVRRLKAAETMAQVTGIDLSVDQERIDQADRLGKLLGKEVYFFSENPTEYGIKHGQHGARSDRIGINAKSPNVLAATFGHELTHSVEIADSYGQLQEMVFTRMKQTGEDIEALRQRKLDLYARNGVELDAKAVDREIVAKYVEEHLLTDEESIRQLVKDDRSMARRILDWLDGVLAKMGNQKSQERQYMLQAREVYRTALQEADSKRARQGIVAQAHDAYREGRDAEGDAVLEQAMEDLPDGWLNDDFSDLEWSFGGENAANIDQEALARAKQMRTDGEENADIFRETGWYVGADGKWRFEIDDSGMKYRRAGDARFMKDHPEYARFRELERKFIDGAITDEEIMEMAALRSTWSDEARRLAERVARGNAWLADVLEHDALYEQYPRLRRVKVRFGDTDDAGGWWDKGRNEIVLSERYRQADTAFLELKLLHEIQHAIQDIEGFAGGSNPEYWEDIQSGSKPIRENDGRIAKAEREAQEALKGIPQEVAKDFWYAANMRHTDPEGAERLENELFEGEYADAYGDYSWAIWTLQDLLEQDNPKRTAKDLYRSTAGEIEARDAVNRRNLDAGIRKNRLPDTGDERTVFVEGGNPVAKDFIGWTADGNEVYQTSAATMGMTSKDRFDAFKKKYLSTFTGRTAKFYRNGHTYYAKFAQTDSELGKLAHEGNDKGSQSSTSGYKAKIRLLADGSIFELVEDAAYHSSKIETRVGKNKTHKHAKHWDYFVKTVVVDGKAYDVVINVRADSRKGDYSDKEHYVYSIRFRDNKTAATPVASPARSKVLRVDGVAVDNSVPDSGQNVKQYSIGEPEEGGFAEGWYDDDEAPTESGIHTYTAGELAEIEELRNRASMEQDDDRERPVWTAVEPERLTGTVKGHYDRVLRQAVDGLARSLNVPRVAKREYLLPIARELGREYMEKGIVSAEVRDRLFDSAWNEGRNQEREFYDTYKEVKDYLRSTGLTLGETDRDSRDWGDIRRRAFGTVKLLNQGGLPVDTAWGELREMAPELFPENIYNPADQLQHMIEVGRSIKPREQTLEEYYGPDAAEVRQMERMDFDAAIQKTIADLWKVKRLADERIAEDTPVAGGSGSQLTQEEVTAMYPKLKDARKAVEKAIAKNILTKRDKEQVQRLLRHDIQPEHLDPKRYNVEGILAVYETKKAFEEIAEPIRAWNRQQKAANYRLAENLLEGVRLKDKKRGFLYSRETMVRNIRDIVKDPEAAERIIRTYFKPVQEASAEAIRIQNRYRDRVRALELSRRVKKGDQVSEAYAVQFYGEVSDILRFLREQENRLRHPNPARLANRVRDGKTYAEWQAELQKLWEENPGLDKGKIENAAREFGKIYEELFEQMNEVRVRNGYEPINHRSGYFPHFQREGRDGILGQFGKALGIDVEVQQLPTTINGLTHTFKPGIRWFGNALERKGFDTTYDAVEGFDRYITGVSDVICHTDNIQRLRALANQIRYRTSDEGIREQIRKIQERTDITEDEKDTLIRERYESGKFELSNFVVELDEYTNLLANKKSRADRNMEQAMGRDMYNIIKSLESRVAANMVAINPGSWLTNFIPITQGWACLDRGNLIRGMGLTLKAMKSDDGMVDRSAFLTGRKGTDALAKTWAQEWSGKLSSPMEWIDGFTAGTLIRARFQQNLQMGLSEAEAMSEADDWAAGVMADRTKGAMPTVFHRSNPLTKLFTQFQLEVNNQLSYLWKDIPREKRDKGMKALALALLKFAVGAWLYNEVYEFFFGRRPALDPVDMVGGFVIDWADSELDFADAALGLGGQIAENTPFVGGLIGGGRVPISSALPDAENLIKAVGNSEWSAGKRIGTAAKELAKPLAYMLPPFGGGQIKKVWEGLNMIAQGGSYTLDAKGNPMLQYPLYSTNNDVQKALEAGQAMIFGKTTIRSGRAWVEGGFGNLSAEQTATYQALIAMDVEQADAFELLTQLREAEKTGEQSRTAVQRDILRASGLEGDALATVYYDLMVSDDSKEKTLMEGLMDAGADIGKVAACLMDMKDAADSNAKRSAIMVSGLDDAGKQQLYQLITEDRNDDIEAFRKAGMDMDDFLEAQNVYTDIQNRYEDEGDMATAFARWVNSQSYTKEQKDTVRDCFKYWRQMPANADGYDRAIEVGLSDEDAAELVEAIGELEPPEGKDSVQQIQKYRVAIDQSVSESNQLRMLQSVGLKDSSYDKVAKGYEMGVAPAAWVRVKEVQQQFDANGNGNMTGAEWEAAIEGICSYGIVLPGDNTRFNLTNEQKAVLWQMMVGKSTKAKNNPFDPAAGQRWRELMGYE